MKRLLPDSRRGPAQPLQRMSVALPMCSSTAPRSLRAERASVTSTEVTKLEGATCVGPTRRRSLRWSMWPKRIGGRGVRAEVGQTEASNDDHTARGNRDLMGAPPGSSIIGLHSVGGAYESRSDHNVPGRNIEP